VRVKARAVIWIDGQLVIAEQRRGGRRDVSLPGGRVEDHESVLDTVRREVTEETGLTVVPRQLLYVFEVVASVRVHALELIFLAEPRGVPNLGRLHALSLEASAHRRDVRPPILNEIARDHALGWRENPRWLGNLARPNQLATGGVSRS
jgi:8-oxo-dGTP pyrophosphatase MutT (NUDIX family)